MKKTLISFVVVIAMLSSMICPAVLANNAFSLGNTIGSEEGVYVDSYDYGRKVVQSEKYVFLLVGDSSKDFRANSKIHIYEKPNTENIGYKYLTSISQPTADANSSAVVRNMHVADDVLYVTWGNAVIDFDSDSQRAKDGAAYLQSPVKAYDVSNVTEGSAPTQLVINNENQLYLKKDLPYTLGKISYFDEENDVLYTSRNAATYRYYAAVNTSGMSSAIESGTAPTPTKKFFVSNSSKSRNAVQFVVKDNWLYEVVQNKAGMPGYDGNSFDGNNTVFMFNLNGQDLQNNQNVSSFLRGTYTTATAGDTVIRDIEVVGNYMYLATTEGIEVVALASAKSASSNTTLSLTKKVTETGIGGATDLDLVNGKLYAAYADPTNNTGAVICYDIVTDPADPEKILSLEAENGFQDMEINTVENMIYALSAEENGEVSILNLDLLFSKLEVSDVTYECDGEEVDEIANGDLTAQMTVTNPNTSTVEFTSYYLLYEGSRLVDVGVEDWSVDPEASVDVMDTLTVENAGNSHVKILLTSQDDAKSLIPMDTGDSVVFEKEFGNINLASATSDELMNIADMDSDGAIAVSGTIEALKGKSVLVTVENASASDLLKKVRYMDVVEVGADGSYSFEFIPTYSGTYTIEITDLLGAGAISDEVVVEEVDITVCNLEEIPGISSELYINLTNGQNVETINFELTFNSEVITVGEELVACDEFTVSGVVIDGNTLTAVFTKLAPITKDEIELCAIPITVNSEAVLDDYVVSADVIVKDKYETVLDSVANSGILSIKASTLKYVAKDEAIAALTALKDPDEITVDDYLAEKEKAAYAAEKLRVAIEDYYVRPSAIPEDLREKLEDVEAKLSEYEPHYAAVDVIESAAAEDIEETLNENKAYFGITEEALALYDNPTNTDDEEKNNAIKSQVNDIMAAADFTKPSDVNKIFAEALVFESFPEVRWQNVEKLLNIAGNHLTLNLADYNNLETAERKAYVQQALQLRDYADVATLQSALNAAVGDAILNVPLPEEGGGGSSSGDTDGYTPGGTRVPGSSVFDQDTGVEVTPPAPVTRPDVFSDIAQCAWAKDAIEYLNGKGVINGIGDGKFAPMDNVTREAFFKMIALGFDISGDESDITFTDVDKNAWYSEYAYALAGAGIINGRGDGRLGVGEYITREEIAVILDRVSQLKGIDIKPNKEAAIPDAANIGEYAVSAVNKMWASGIINGFEDGTVRPGETASRAQVAQLIYKVILIQYGI